jgi:predicted transcriptional regulator
MTRPTTPKPTDAELAILRVLWDRGPSTVRQVHDVLGRERPTAYTTALKLLQIMTEKGLVERDERDRTHVYHARLSEEQTQRQLIRDLLDRAFGGSASKLVMQALAARRASADELREIRRAIDVARQDGRSMDLPPESGSHKTSKTDLLPDGGSPKIRQRKMDLPSEGGSHKNG